MPTDVFFLSMNAGPQTRSLNPKCRWSCSLPTNSVHGNALSTLRMVIVMLFFYPWTTSIHSHALSAINKASGHVLFHLWAIRKTRCTVRRQFLWVWRYLPGCHQPTPTVFSRDSSTPPGTTVFVFLSTAREAQPLAWLAEGTCNL